MIYLYIVLCFYSFHICSLYYDVWPVCTVVHNRYKHSLNPGALCHWFIRCLLSTKPLKALPPFCYKFQALISSVPLWLTTCFLVDSWMSVQKTTACLYQALTFHQFNMAGDKWLLDSVNYYYYYYYIISTMHFTGDLFFQVDWVFLFFLSI